MSVQPSSFTIITAQGRWVITDHSAHKSKWQPRELDSTPSLTVGQVTDLANKKDPTADQYAVTLLGHDITKVDHRGISTKIVYKAPKRTENQSNYAYLQVDLAALKGQLRLLIAGPQIGFVPNDTPNYKTLGFKVTKGAHPIKVLNRAHQPFFEGASYRRAEELYFRSLDGGGLGSVRMLVTQPKLDENMGRKLLEDMQEGFDKQETVTADNQGWKNACEVLSKQFSQDPFLGIIRSCFFTSLKFVPIPIGEV